MKVTFLGQAGLLFEAAETTIMIDPYFSDSVQKIQPQNYRRAAVDERVFDIKPDILIFTHKHLDHYDPATVEKFIDKATGITVLAPGSVWDEVRKIGGNNMPETPPAPNWWSTAATLCSFTRSSKTTEESQLHRQPNARNKRTQKGL